MSRLPIAAAAAVLSIAGSSFAALQAGASLTPAPAGSNTQWSLTLNNTGTTTVGTLWFAWIPGQNYLAAAPTSITSPAGWTAVVTHGGATDGWGIQWTANNVAARLAAGGNLSGFGFTSNMNAQAMAGNSPFYPGTPVTRSFVYSGGAFSDTGFQFTATVVPAPTAAALAFGGLTLAFRRRRAALD